MLRVIIRQTILGVFVVLSALTLTFILVRFSGDPTSIILPMEATEMQREELRERLGLNQGILDQYVSYLLNAARGDFGYSYFDGEPVSTIIFRFLPNTLLLAGLALSIGLVLSVTIGVFSAIWQGGLFDRCVQVVAVLAASMPAFWVGLLLIQFFAVGLNLFPTYGTGSAAHLVLPVLTLVLYLFPSLVRLTRSSMLEILPQSYVTTARAKGMPETRVIARTVVRNGIVPVLTLFALEVGNLIGGAILTETVFAWPGIGRLAIIAIERRDFPVVQGVVGYVAIGFVVVTVLTEVIIRLVNPKLRQK